MFTGLIEERGEVLDLAVTPEGDSARLTVRATRVTGDAGHGDSIAVSGVCLTVVDRGEGMFTADVMAETLARTTIGRLVVGDRVNLERSVLPTTRLGGHLVQGHVDGVGTLIERVSHPAYDEIKIAIPAAIARYVAPKGAIAVDGISLTVIDVVDGGTGPDSESVFSIGLIPETRHATTLGAKPTGSILNIEVDVMAKYVERLLISTTTNIPATGTEDPRKQDLR